MRGLRRGQERLGGRHSVHDRHAQIHEDDLRRQGRGQLDRLAAVGGLADDLQARLTVQHADDPRAHQTTDRKSVV